MPADLAAASRLMPSSALAMASMRRPMRASGSAFASLRSTAGVRSRRIESAHILPTIESTTQGSHTHEVQGTSRRQHESGVSADGIRRCRSAGRSRADRQAWLRTPIRSAGGMAFDSIFPSTSDEHLPSFCAPSITPQSTFSKILAQARTQRAGNAALLRL